MQCDTALAWYRLSVYPPWPVASLMTTVSDFDCDSDCVLRKYCVGEKSRVKSVAIFFPVAMVWHRKLHRNLYCMYVCSTVLSVKNIEHPLLCFVVCNKLYVVHIV